MKHQICSVVNFLNEEHKAAILDAAREGDFEVCFYDGPEAAEGKVSEAEIVYATRPEVFQQAKEMKWAASSNAGIDPLLKPGVLPEGCILTKGAGTYGVTISEHIIGVLINMLKRFPEYYEYVKRHEWKQGLPIHSIYGSRITIVGTGDIGNTTARRLKAFEPASITGVNRSGESRDASYDRIVTHDHLLETLAETDILILCAPETPATNGMMNREAIMAMPEGSYIVNVGRGSAIVQADLIEALESGHIAGAALDVTVPEPLPADDPLWDAPNVLITTHISGWMTLSYTADQSVRLFCDNIRRYAKGETLEHLVNFELGY